MNIKEAATFVAKELSTDETYYYTWQSNIAICMYDAIRTDNEDSPDLLKKCNEGAKAFLNMLIKE